MIRLTLILSAFIFVMLLVLGEDRGQRRAGLMAADTGPLAASPIVEAAAAIPAEPLNLPDQPVIQAATPAPVVEPDAVAQTDPTAEAVAAGVAVEISAPDAPDATEAAMTVDGKLRWIDANSVNVREGPSTEAAVLGKLSRGEAVLVVLEEGGAAEGWSRVRIEGDGIEGFVATRFLTDAQP